MLRRLAFTLLLILLLGVSASAREKRFGYCQTANLGLRVTNCTVEVFVTGTLTHPTNGIFQDNLGTPQSNPFTANATTGLWSFYADNGHYDVQMSGGAPTISPAYTLSDWLFLDLGIQPLISTAFQSASANIAQSGIIQLASADSICWANASPRTSDNCLSETAGGTLTFNGAVEVQTNTVYTATGFVTHSGGDTFTLVPTFSAGITGTGNTGALLPGTGITSTLLSTANVYSAIQTAPAWVSGTVNPALSGVIRLANADAITSRNPGNSADVSLITLDIFGIIDIGFGNNGADINGIFVGGASASIAATQPLAAGPGANVSLLATNGSGVGPHVGGNIVLTPGIGNNGGASGVISLGLGTTVALLPAAASNAGAFAYVTDSTSIGAEGQTCVGSSTNKALAWSNGTNWKCF